MVEYPVSISQLAHQDLKAIYDYIYDDLQSPRTAEQLLDLLEEKIKSLSIFPERCPVVDGLPEGIVIRRLVVKRYNLFYRFLNDQVTILRVLHSSTSLERLFKDL